MYNQEIQQSSETNPRFFYGYTIVVAAFFIMLISMGTYTSFGVFLKPIMNEFGWTSAMTSGALSLSLVAIALLGIGMGGLNDRFGPRVVVSISGFLFGLGYLLLSQVNAVWHLYLFYGLIIGTAVSSTWVPLLSTVAKWFTKTRSFVTGIVMAGVSVGGLIVPLVAVQFIFAFGWRVSYLLLGSIILVIVVSAAQFLRRDKEQVGLIRNGGNRGEKLGPEFRTEGLSLNKAVHRRQFWFLFFASFCSGFCIWTVLVHIVPHAIELGFSPATASTILATISGLSITGRIVLGSAGDRIGNRQVLIIGFVLMSASFFWLVPAMELWKLYLFAIVFGFAYGGSGMAPSPLAAAMFGVRSHGSIYGVLNFAFSMGSAIGPFATAYIFDVTGGYEVAFIASAAVGILGLVFTAMLKQVRGKTAEM